MVDGDVFCWFVEGDQVLAGVFWDLFGERPLGGVDVLVVRFPEAVRDAQVRKYALVHYLDAFVLMTGVEVEVGTSSYGVLGIRLPNAILKLYYRVLDHKIDSKINFGIHRVRNPNKNLTTILALLLTKFLTNILQL
jgi:hypothetical protein